MRYRPLGNTGVNVSEIGFGTWSIGGKDYGPTDDKTSTAALRRAYELGITFYDTADLYGEGRSERLIAKALKGHFRSIFIATKIGYNFYGGNPRKEFHEAYLRRAAEECLKRLSTEQLDLLQLHNPSEEVLGRGEVFETLQKLATEGKIRFWGVSVSSAKAALLALSAGTATLQLVYNLLRPELLSTIAGEVKTTKTGLIARTPLEFGLLSGKFRQGHLFCEGDHRAKRWDKAAFAKRLTQVETFRFLIEEEVPVLSEAALRYVLSNPLVSVVVPGIRTRSQIEQLVKSSEGKGYLRPERLAQIAVIQKGFSDPVQCA